MNNFRLGVLQGLADNGVTISDLNYYLEKESTVGTSTAGSAIAAGAGGTIKGLGQAASAFLELPLLKPVGIPVGLGVLGSWLLANREGAENKAKANRILREYQNEILLDDIRLQRNKLERENEQQSNSA